MKDCCNDPGVKVYRTFGIRTIGDTTGDTITLNENYLNRSVSKGY